MGDAYDGHQSVLLVIFAVFATSSMILSLVIMLFCTRSIMKNLLSLDHSVHRHLQIQVYNTLLIQSGVPFIFLHVPFYVCMLAPLVNITIGFFNTYLPYLFAWCPVLNPLIVFYFVAEIRNYLIQKLKLICCFKKPRIRILKVTAHNETMR
ncbi:unnamed protein product [Angiostrongylus costaricensis]|uniref:G protein-coupled receptor n=1 Tax=Angiostrongylus costaricensis TaxID=334426 RepID=A0A0R3Q1N6_ANGCS|nr:unnamed protein product [Angiostrongylus costaricensis]